MKINTLENILIICILLFILNTYLGLWLFPLKFGIILEVALLVVPGLALLIDHLKKPKLI